MKPINNTYRCVASLLLVLMVQLGFASSVVRSGDGDDRRLSAKPSLHSLAGNRTVKLTALRGYQWVRQGKVQTLQLPAPGGQQMQLRTTLQFTKGNTSFQLPQKFTLKVPRFKPTTEQGSRQRF